MVRAAFLGVALCIGGCAGTGPVSEERQEGARVNMQLGVEHLRRGQLPLAETNLLRAVQLDPGSADAHTALGVLYQRLKEWPEAERAFRRAAELRPDDGSIQNNLGVFLCERGKNAEGLRLLLRAAEAPRYPTPEAAWTNAAVCLGSGNVTQREQYLRNALERNPAFPDALLQMASLSLRQQDYLRARAFLSRFESTGRATAEALFMRSRAERALGDISTADRYLLRLRTEFPDSQEAAQALSR